VVNKHSLYPLLHHVEDQLTPQMHELIAGNLQCYEIDEPLYPFALYMNKCTVREQINNHLESLYAKSAPDYACFTLIKGGKPNIQKAMG
jgi:hypothetical protein